MHTHPLTQLSVPARERLHSIGRTARILGISAPTLRLHEREGCILPHRKPSGHRLYSSAEIERVQCIRETITVRKVSIGGIQRLLEDPGMPGRTPPGRSGKTLGLCDR
jgi:DNA-binding transcriptional MerR regulator